MIFLHWQKLKKRGVAIYVRQELKPKKNFQDEEGRMLAVKVTIDQEKKNSCWNLCSKRGKRKGFF